MVLSFYKHHRIVRQSHWLQRYCLSKSMLQAGVMGKDQMMAAVLRVVQMLFVVMLMLMDPAAMIMRLGLALLCIQHIVAWSRGCRMYRKNRSIRGQVELLSKQYTVDLCGGCGMYIMDRSTKFQP